MREQTNLDPENPAHWTDIIDQSAYTPTYVSKEHGISPAKIKRYANKEVRPQKKTLEKIVSVMAELVKTSKHPYHPSFGYATPEEFNRLRELKEGGEKQELLRTIEARTRLHGKTA